MKMKRYTPIVMALAASAVQAEPQYVLMLSEVANKDPITRCELILKDSQLPGARIYVCGEGKGLNVGEDFYKLRFEKDLLKTGRTTFGIAGHNKNGEQGLAGQVSYAFKSGKADLRYFPEQGFVDLFAAGKVEGIPMDVLAGHYRDSDKTFVRYAVEVARIGKVKASLEGLWSGTPGEMDNNYVGIRFMLTEKSKKEKQKHNPPRQRLEQRVRKDFARRRR